MEVHDIVQEAVIKTIPKKKKCKKAKGLSEESLEIAEKRREENSRMGNTSHLFKKIRDTKGTFHAKMGITTGRNGMDLTETEAIKRWQEYTEELYKKRSS